MNPDQNLQAFRGPRSILVLLTVLALCWGTGAAAVEPLSGAGDPEELLRYLAQAADEDDAPLYISCLDDSFRFVPYHSVPSQYPDIDWKHWGRKQERIFAEEWLGPMRTAGLDLDLILDRTSISLDQEEWDVFYQMVLDGAQFSSRAVFVMRRVGHRWYLAEWIDTTLLVMGNGVWVPTSGAARALIRP